MIIVLVIWNLHDNHFNRRLIILTEVERNDKKIVLSLPLRNEATRDFKLFGLISSCSCSFCDITFDEELSVLLKYRNNAIVVRTAIITTINPTFTYEFLKHFGVVILIFVDNE